MLRMVAAGWPSACQRVEQELQVGRSDRLGELLAAEQRQHLVERLAVAAQGRGLERVAGAVADLSRLGTFEAMLAACAQGGVGRCPQGAMIDLALGIGPPGAGGRVAREAPVELAAVLALPDPGLVASPAPRGSQWPRSAFVGALGRRSPPGVGCTGHR